ncbi:hypothetical protein M408DRAFT_281596 [Serendipita vermifera MAFF 305830]|uniref:Uncharacterized protein n=1 Tax=Serendipita vermifera MAFF 305830 TaxID=933852 RepID=A0A0C2WZG6_SERVB|nr:hypothetical protein M408DRAFT_281596 [Serendipita vermifera MAFF 305830]
MGAGQCHAKRRPDIGRRRTEWRGGFKLIPSRGNKGLPGLRREEGGLNSPSANPSHWPPTRNTDAKHKPIRM